MKTRGKLEGKPGEIKYGICITRGKPGGRPGIFVYKNAPYTPLKPPAPRNRFCLVSMKWLQTCNKTNLVVWIVVESGLQWIWFGWSKFVEYSDRFGNHVDKILTSRTQDLYWNVDDILDLFLKFNSSHTLIGIGNQKSIGWMTPKKPRKSKSVDGIRFIGQSQNHILRHSVYNISVPHN